MTAAEKLKRLGEILGTLRRPEVTAAEDHRTLALDGAGIDARVFGLLVEVFTIAAELGSPARISSDDDLFDEHTQVADVVGFPWKLQIGKPALVQHCPSSDQFENTLLFFFADLFVSWSLDLDPFKDDDLNSSKTTRIFVRTLRGAFGSTKLAVLPWFEDAGVAPGNCAAG